MKKLTCNCGWTAEGENRYFVEASMWHHAIRDHLEMLQQMTVEQLQAWLENTNKTLTAAE